jgi:hypothetical protein
LRLRALASLLLALERRRIAHSKLRTTLIFKVRLHQGFAPGEMGFNDKFALQKQRAISQWVNSGRLSFYGRPPR